MSERSSELGDIIRTVGDSVIGKRPAIGVEALPDRPDRLQEFKAAEDESDPDVPELNQMGASYIARQLSVATTGIGRPSMPLSTQTIGISAAHRLTSSRLLK